MLVENKQKNPCTTHANFVELVVKVVFDERCVSFSIEYIHYSVYKTLCLWSNIVEVANPTVFVLVWDLFALCFVFVN